MSMQEREFEQDLIIMTAFWQMRLPSTWTSLFMMLLGEEKGYRSKPFQKKKKKRKEGMLRHR